jgi:hypothetical protein
MPAKLNASDTIALLYSLDAKFENSFEKRNGFFNTHYKITVLPVVLYGCETWSLTLKEERRLRVFENRVLRRIFGPNRDEVTGEWRKVHNDKIEKNEMGGACNTYVGSERCVQGFGGET